MDSEQGWSDPSKEASSDEINKVTELVSEDKKTDANSDRLSRDHVLRIQNIAERLHDNVEKVIVGKSDVVNLALVAILCEGHISFRAIQCRSARLCQAEVDRVL